MLTAIINKYKIVFTLLILMLVAGSCDFFSKHKGYKKVSPGIWYKLLQFGESTVVPDVGDIITVDIKYKTLDDSIFFHGRRKLEYSKPSFSGSIDECFGILKEGDKAEFIISADKFFENTINSSLPAYIHEHGEMIAEIEMIDIQTVSEYKNEKEAFLSWIEDFGEYERVILRQFIDEEGIDIKPTTSGLIYIVTRPGTGKKVALGDTIIFHYEGKFLNGVFFDSSIKRKEPFGFVYGQQWQVIKGLEEGLGMMSEGEKALFILPSELAFGETGSSTGIIPPYTSLIFEVEMLEVK